MPAATGRRMRRCPGPFALLLAAAMVLALCAVGAAPPAMAQAPAGEPAPASPAAPAQPAPATPAADSQAPRTPIPAAQAPQTQAQPATPTGDLPLAEPAVSARQELERLALLLGRIEAAAQRGTMSDQDLADLRGELDSIGSQALRIANATAPLVNAVQDRLDQFGPAPENGTAEAPAIAVERAQQTTLREAYNGIVKQARLLAVQADQLSGAITERRRAQFADRIFERRESALDPRLWAGVLTAAPLVASRFTLILSDWWGTFTERLNLAALATLALALAAVVLVFTKARPLLLSVCSRDPSLARPSQLRRAVAAAWLTAIHILVPALAALVVFLPLRAFSLLPAPVDQLFFAGARAIIFFSLAQGLAWALLAPARTAWRIIPLPEAAARRVLMLVLAAATTYALDLFFSTVDGATFAPLQLAIGEDVIVSLLIAIFIAIAITTAFRSVRRATPATEIPARWRWLGALVYAVLIVIPVAAVLGYLALAKFMAAQLVIGATILGLLVLAMRLVDAVLTEGLERHAGGDEAARARQARRLQVGIIVSGLLRVLLVILALFLLAIPWGYEMEDLLAWGRTFFFGFTVGGVTISPSAIMLAIVVFIIGILVTRAVQRWLETSLLPHTRFDTGIRNSLKTAFGYAGIFIAAAVGFTFAGLDLSNLAIVAGALSVGIGFGLQSIVNNFVSGLILLAERPIKDGDWIVVGGDEGYVSKISVRSTQIETFDRATVIVPNSDLISGVVKNWMHSNQMGRVRVPVGVSYSSDAEQVREILLKCADEHPSVMKVPAPVVYFMDFGASSLDFELRAHIIKVDSGLTVRSELRFAILKALREADIEIPFPQQDLHLRDLERLEKLLASAKEPAGKARRAAPPRRGKGAAAKKQTSDAGARRKPGMAATDLEDSGPGSTAGATGDEGE